jgi:P-type Ca2+ transporter type 2C
VVSAEGLVNDLRSHRITAIGGHSDAATDSSSPLGAEVSVSPSTTLREAEEGLGRAKKGISLTIKSKALDEDPDSAALIAQRRAVFLDSHLPTKRELTFLNRAWMTYNDPVLFLFTAAATVSLAIVLYQTFTTVHTAGNPSVEWAEGVAIITAIVIIVLVGSINDWEKSRQFKKLNEKQLERDAKMVLFGTSRVISGSEMLVGDVVILEPGDLIPADGILLNGYNVMCDESSATGESDLIHKTSGDEVFRELNDRGEEYADSLLPALDPFLLSGTEVLEGVGTFLVTATGANSTYGRILSQVSESDNAEPTPLQSRLPVLAKYVARIGGVISLLFFFTLFIRFLVELPHNYASPTDKDYNSRLLSLSRIRHDTHVKGP